MTEQWMNQAFSPEERAVLLLAELSLDEKLAQVGCIFPFGDTAKDFDAISAMMPLGIGEVSTLEMRRIETLEGCAAWQRKVQALAMAQSPHHIPAIFHMEGLCGAFIQDTASFPSGTARGAGFDPALEEEIAKTVSRQEAACGVTHVLGPVLDVARDPRMGRQGESYGEDPALCAALGAAYTRGVQSEETAGRRMDSVAKHFLAFHTGQGGIHGAHSEIPARQLEEIYAKPFQAAINEGLHGVMPCYCIIGGEPASVSKTLLTNILREKMGFDGLCFSDYGGITNAHFTQHLFDTVGETGLAAMEAGMDIETPSVVAYGEELRALFAEGKADMAILDRAVQRVLTAKFRMGLFEHPFALEGDALRKTVVHEEDRALSLRSARESLVLLKNDGILPLSKQIKRLAVIGPHAAYARKMFGGYTHLCMMESTYAAANSIAGVAGVEGIDPEKIVTIPGTHVQSDETEELDAILRRQKPDCRSLLAELQARLPDTEILYAYGYPVAGADESGYAQALAAIESADAAIVTLGGKHGTCSLATMGEGVDGTSINLPTCQEAFLRRAARLGKPLVGVHFDGRPISSDAADECLSALLECWSPAETGAEAVTDALLGKVNPGGKLPVTVARHAGQLPVYYNHPWNSQWHQTGSIGFHDYVDCPHAPRYPFGFGLSYTTFAYSGLRLSSAEVAPDGVVQVSCAVTNTGERTGDEIVQLYLCDEYASMARPVKELAGFKRFTLAPNETKQVVFTVSMSQLAFLDRDMRWKVESGKILVEIGASSEDIRLCGAFTITGNAWLSGRDRALYAEVNVQ